MRSINLFVTYSPAISKSQINFKRQCQVWSSWFRCPSSALILGLTSGSVPDSKLARSNLADQTFLFFSHLSQTLWGSLWWDPCYTSSRPFVQGLVDSSSSQATLLIRAGTHNSVTLFCAGQKVFCDLKKTEHSSCLSIRMCAIKPWHIFPKKNINISPLLTKALFFLASLPHQITHMHHFINR